MQINLSPTSNYYFKNSVKPQFCGVRGCVSDTFEKEKNGLEVYNPYTDSYCKTDKKFSYDIKQEFAIIAPDKSIFLLDYDPERTDYLFDKKSGKSVEVNVLKSQNLKDENEFCYHFMSKDLKKEYGYALYSKYKTGLEKGVEEVCVRTFDKDIQGLNELADKYAVQFCIENNLDKNVISYPKPENYREHYQAGKRFVPPEENSEQYRYLMSRYKQSDPNEILKNDFVKTSKFPALKMVLPEEKTKYYSNNFLVGGFALNDYAYEDVYQLSCGIGGTRPKRIVIGKNIDLTKPQTFTYRYKTGHSWIDSNEFTVEFDPKKTGQIYDKRTGKPIEVFILKSHDTQEEDMDTLHFFSKDLKHEYGHVELDTDYKGYDYNLRYNYSDPKIVGKRLVISWLKNEDDDNIGGIGKLADKSEVKYCVENNIPTTIISTAGDDSHLAHYKRGKRFVKPEKGTSEYRFLMRTYGCPNPNRVLKELAKESERTGQKIDLSKWNGLDFVMYLPQRLVEKYKKEP